MTDNVTPEIVPTGTVTIFRLLPVGQQFNIKGRSTVLVKTSAGFARNTAEQPVAVFGGCKVVAR